MKRTTTGKLIAFAAALMLVFALFAGCTVTTNQGSTNNSDVTPSASQEASAPASSPAEAAKVYTLGISQIVDHPSLDLCRQGAIDKLAELGFVEGQNLTVNYQSAAGEPANATTIAQQFVADNADVIMAISTPSAQAAYAAAKDKIPVVFSAVTDPAAAGFANTDGSNIKGVTGTSDALPLAKTLELIKALVPDAVNVGILHNTSEVNSDVQLEQLKELAPTYGMQIVDSGITSTNEMATALDTLLPKVDVVMNLTDNMVVSALPLEIQKCNEAKIPLIGSEDTQVTNGALASTGIDYYALGQKTGEMIASILNGTAPETIPIFTSDEPMLTINSDQVTALGITVPADMQSTAKFVTTAQK